MSSQFLEKYKEYIIQQYTKEKKSTYEIAQDIGTYPNKIRRTGVRRFLKNNGRQ